MFWKKKSEKKVSYDKEKMQPVLKVSICTGEKVVGFLDKESGKFEDIMLIRNEKELSAFCEMYGVESGEIGKIY